MVTDGRAAFHATPYPVDVNILSPEPVQVIPSAEYAIVFVPCPTATHLNPFQTTTYPAVVNILFP